jgi:hypothetical protein
MYIQVLDQSTIKIYDMIKEMTKNGSILIGRKVDCAIVHYVNSDLPKEVKGEEWGSVRDCYVPIMEYEKEFLENEYNFKRNWKDWNIDDSDDWEKIMDVMTENGGLLLQSDAGNGKSYVAKNISKAFPNVKK